MRSRVFVGRRSELAELVARLEAPNGSLTAVVGEAGAGKTRLVGEVSRRATERGLLVAWGRATADARMTPYRPFAEALLAACRPGGPPQAQELVAFRPALGRLIPEWHDPTAAPTSPLVLAEGVLRALDILGGRTGTLLVLEDLHWADAESLAALEYLADNSPTTSVRVVATIRAEPGPASRTLGALTTRRAATAIDLAPLPDDDVAEMARSCLDSKVLPDGLTDMLTRADGLPYLVEELLAAGVVVRRDGRWTVPDDAPWVVPQSLAEAAERKVAELPPADRVVPRAAALLGRDVDLVLLARLLDRTPQALDEVIERCAALQLLSRTPTGGYRFRHALTRDTVLGQLGPATRTDLALRARNLIHSEHPGLPGPWRARTAELSRLCGDDVGAARLLLEAADSALAGGAVTTARDVLRTAEPLARSDRALARTIAERLVDVAKQAGDTDSTLAWGRVFLADADADADAGADAGDRAAQARVAVTMAEAAVAAGRWSEAFELLASAGERVDDAGAARVDAVRAEALLGAGRPDDARASAERARAAAARLGIGDSACLALEVLGRIARDGDLRAAEDLFDEQLRIATAHRLPLWRIKAAHQLGTIDLMRANDTGRLERARAQAVEAGALATAAVIDLQLAGAAWMSWDVTACLTAARRCRDAARHAGLGLPMVEAILAEAGAHCVAGDRRAMEASIAEARAAGLSGSELAASVHSRHGLLALVKEDRRRALSCYEAAVAESRRAPSPYLRPFWNTWALLRALDQSDPSSGAGPRDEVRPRTPVGTMTGALLDYADAVAAGRRGHGGEAAALVARAQSVLGPPGFAAQRHLADRLVAESALAEGWGEPVEWLTSAAQFYRGSGHEHLERACRSLLRRAGVPLPRRSRGSGQTTPPHLAARGITDREADVLALVVDGLTSPEIGARLFISPRTVDKHVERLLAKTGVARRTELRQLRT